jgi:hypothetical protein
MSVDARMSSLWLFPPSIYLTVELVFCRDHAAPSSLPLSNTHASDKKNGTAAITLCFGKPICMSCYDELHCEDLLSIEEHHEHWQTYLPWISCQCRKSFVCMDCHYHDREIENESLCQLCNGNEREAVDCHCRKCDEKGEGAESDENEDMNAWTDCDSDEEEFKNEDSKDNNLEDDHDDTWMDCDVEIESINEDNDIRFHSDEDIHDFYMHSVDWTANNGLLEELGIVRTSQLGEFIIRLIDEKKASSAHVFKFINMMLSGHPTSLYALNGNVPIKRDEEGKLDDWVTVLPDQLSKLVESLETAFVSWSDWESHCDF